MAAALVGGLHVVRDARRVRRLIGLADQYASVDAPTAACRSGDGRSGSQSRDEPVSTGLATGNAEPAIAASP